ncbi:MAG: hypothetical protein WKF86_07410 [Acidimicrobiales bacterium]
MALADGKILAYAIGGLDNTALTTKAAIYEPASGLWAPATPPPPLAEPTDALGVLLADDPGTPLVNECAPRCGQVLVHAYTNWLRFNPVGPGVWEDVPAPAYSKRAFVVNGAIPLVDDPATSGIVECGQSCGKVFITAEEGGTPTADLYDPASDLFESIAYPLGLEPRPAGAPSPRARRARSSAPSPTAPSSPTSQRTTFPRGRRGGSIPRAGRGAVPATS